MKTLQLNTSLTRKLGIEGQNLYREGDFIYHALAGAMTAGKQLKILDVVFLSVTVLVVNCFLFVKRAPKVFCHGVTMLQNRMFFAGNGTGYANPYVSMTFDMSTMNPRIKTPTSLSNLKVYLTFLIAELLRTVINSSPRAFVFAHRVNRPTLQAREEALSFGRLLFGLTTTLGRTIHRVFAKLLAVGVEVSWLKEKISIAVLALKFDWLFVGKSPAVFEFVLNAARHGAVLLRSVVWFNGKSFSAVFANLLNRHAGSGSLIMGSGYTGKLVM